MVYNGSKPYFLMDDLGIPLFMETPIYLLKTWRMSDPELRLGIGTIPGDSTRDLFIPARWRSPFQPLSLGHKNIIPKRSPAELPGRLFSFSLNNYCL